MSKFVDRITAKALREYRYYRGMQTMHRERFSEYRRRLDAALATGDAKTARDIADDLAIFGEEIASIERREQSANGRLAVLQNGSGFLPYAAQDGAFDRPARQK